MFTINDTIRRAVIYNRNGTAVRCEDGSSVSWDEFHERVQAIAGALIARGFKKGDRVAILSLNNSTYYQFMFGVIWAGGVVVPINTRFAPKEVETCVNDLNGAWLCSDEFFVDMLARIKPELKAIHGHYFVGSGDTPSGYVSFATLLEGDASLVKEDPLKEDLAIIYFTGGTTGKPKGAMLTHSQVKHAAQQVASGLRTGNPLGSTDTYLHIAPMFHLGDGIMCFVAPMVTCANSFMKTFDVPELVKHCKDFGVGWMTLVPTMVKVICDYLQANKISIPGIKGIMYGGSPMPESILSQAMETFPGLQLFQGYGATEAMIIAMLEPKFHSLDEDRKHLLKAAGRPFRGVLVGIFDREGKQLPTGEIGEVYVRSNAVMKGYWNNEELTAKALKGNWYHTGDAGYLNDEGFLFLVDRVKDMVISGGENVYSAEVENAVLTHPDVEECAIIGLPDEKWGEVVHAVVKCKDGASLTAETLQGHCREWIAGYKVPKSIDFITEPLPKTSVGKINKVALREERKA